jgi:hypothetical protein
MLHIDDYGYQHQKSISPRPESEITRLSRIWRCFVDCLECEREKEGGGRETQKEREMEGGSKRARDRKSQEVGSTSIE